jgi:hypothetical protein
MSYIYPAPGNPDAQVILKVTNTGGNLANTSATITMPALQDVTVNAANDVFTWTQLDEAAKKQIATTATNSLAMNLVLDQGTFFGSNAAATGSSTAPEKGIFGLSKFKTKVDFSLYLGDTDTGGAGKTITGSGYVTGLAPTVSADSPVWVSPITITVDGDYGIQ